MKINKQLFEDVLSGKLEGLFILRNGDRWSSQLMKRPDIVCYRDKYELNFQGEAFYDDRKCLIFEDNGMHYIGTISPLDIIDFRPTKNMKETKELKIEIPEGYCIDESKSTFEKIVFKKKDTKPRSWEEYCENHKGSYYLINSSLGGKVSGLTYSPNKLIKIDPENSRHVLPSKELAEAFLAMMQLMSLRQAWIHEWSVKQNLIEDWEPDYSDFNEDKYSITNFTNKFNVRLYGNISRPLSFPTQEMAEDFLKCFKDLLETAKPLL